jgi:hypothetical protein
VLRPCFNSRLGDVDQILHVGRPPFGTMKKMEIEPELWPRLECKPQLRKFKHWIWWLTKVWLNEDSHTICAKKASESQRVNPVSNAVLKDPSQISALTWDWSLPNRRLAVSWIGGKNGIRRTDYPGIRKHPWLRYLGRYREV